MPHFYSGNDDKDAKNEKCKKEKKELDLKLQRYIKWRDATYLKACCFGVQLYAEREEGLYRTIPAPHKIPVWVLLS